MALSGNTLTLTGLDFNAANSTDTSYYAQITVPEPSTVSVLGAVLGMCLSRRRRK